MTDPSLGLLATRLKACPSRDPDCAPERVLELWSRFQEQTIENEYEMTPAPLAGLLLFDDPLSASLLSEAERAQLAALAQAALERFQDQNNNKLGKTLAAALKEST